jgi:hypothetical protein
MLKLPIDAAWNVIWDSGDKNYTSDGKGIHVTYPKGKFASAAGANFRAQPKGFPYSTVSVSYKVFFPADFDFVLGGKLPGVWGGEPGSGGGDWNSKGWSARVMFREGGDAVAYLYMCTDQGGYNGSEKCALARNQGPGFDAIAHHTHGAGIDLWRGTGLRFKKGAWNAVTLAVTRNAPGKSNGSVALTVNDRTQTFGGVCWSEAAMKINGFLFASWMGGGSREYAPQKTQQASFKDFVISGTP